MTIENHCIMSCTTKTKVKTKNSYFVCGQGFGHSSFRYAMAARLYS